MLDNRWFSYNAIIAQIMDDLDTIVSDDLTALESDALCAMTEADYWRLRKEAEEKHRKAVADQLWARKDHNERLQKKHEDTFASCKTDQSIRSGSPLHREIQRIHFKYPNIPIEEIYRMASRSANDSKYNGYDQQKLYDLLREYLEHRKMQSTGSRSRWWN